MASKLTCDCGNPLTGKGLQELCPSCLLLGGLASSVRSRSANVQQVALQASFSNGLRPAQGSLRYLGDYEILEEIARGGMGIVYRACQVSLNRIVAIKMIVAGAAAHPAEVERFRLEARAAARLQHPNIVTIHEVGEDQGLHYFSMDYVEGTSLANLVRSGPLPDARAANYVKTIAEAIHYAHERGILHRDLKPSNVLIDQFDQARIIDFGLAKLIEGSGSATDSGLVVGSPQFMSPEQAEGRCDEVGVRSDVYALGGILYQLVSGCAPLRTETESGSLAGSAHNDLITPRHLNPALPRELEAICLKCLEEDPLRRYGSAADLAAELGRFLRRAPSEFGRRDGFLACLAAVPVC